MNVGWKVIVLLSGFTMTGMGGGIVGKAACGDAGGVLWNIGGEDHFNVYNSYPVEEIGRNEELGRIGRVTVDLASEHAICPHGLGRWMQAQGRKCFVKEIVFQFPSGRAGDFRLHVIWNALEKGSDQFEVEVNGAPAGKSQLVDGSKQLNRFQVTHEKFPVHIQAGDNALVVRLLSGDGLRFRNIVLCDQEEIGDLPRALSPFLEIRSQGVFQTVIGEPAVEIDSPFIRMYAPKRREGDAHKIFAYLRRAYEAYHELTGVHTRYKVVVLAFPRECIHCFGGMSQETCAIYYSFGLLDLMREDNPFLKQYGVPRIDGVVSEMGHAFNGGSGVCFGMEADGVCISQYVVGKVAPDPRVPEQKRKMIEQMPDTVKRYIEGGCVFPDDVPKNLADRIHRYLLVLSEHRYGESFWPDFFKEARKRQDRMQAAKDVDEAYRLTIECFDALPGLEFKKLLREFQMSLTTDCYTLVRRDPWDRRLETPAERGK
ncbi:MAG: hypothetical protein ACYTG0_31395 [Planctomycetota bacterium]